MKLIVCPFCKKKTTNSDYCLHCYNEIKQANKTSYLLRTIKEAVIRDDKREITKLTNLYLEREDNNLVNYYFLYASNNKERFSLVLNNDKEVYEVLNHQYLHQAKLVDMEHFIESQNDNINKDELFTFLVGLYSDDYSQEARVYDNTQLDKIDYKINFPESKRKNYFVLKGFLLLSISIISLLTFYFLIIKKVGPEVKFFYTVFALIIPAIFFGLALSMFIIKKINFLISLLLSLIYILFVSYIFLFSYEDSLLNHFVRVFKAVFEFIEYLEREFKP